MGRRRDPLALARGTKGRPLSTEEQPQEQPRPDQAPAAGANPEENAAVEPAGGTEETDLLLWALLVLVLVAGLTWFLLARRPVTQSPVALRARSTSQATSLRTASPEAALASPAASRGTASPASPASPRSTASPASPRGTASPAAHQAAASPAPPDPEAAPPPPPEAEGGGGAMDSSVLYVGGEPTLNPSSWAYVHGDLLLGALREVDSDEATALNPAQLKAVARLLEEIKGPAGELAGVSEKLVNTVQAILEPRQMAAMTAQEVPIMRSAPDVEALVARLEAVGGSAAPQKIPVDEQATPAVYPANFLIAGLAFLETSPRAPLKPGQVATILPLLKAYAQKLKGQTAFYPRLMALLKAQQAKAFRNSLASMRVEENPPLEERHMTLSDMQLYVQERLSR